MSLTDHYTALVLALESSASAGDEHAARVLGAMALLCEGWRPGDPDPAGPDDPGDGEVIDFTTWKRAA